MHDANRHSKMNSARVFLSDTSVLICEHEQLSPQGGLVDIGKHYLTASRENTLNISSLPPLIPSSHLLSIFFSSLSCALSTHVGMAIAPLVLISAGLLITVCTSINCRITSWSLSSGYHGEGSPVRVCCGHL